MSSQQPNKERRTRASRQAVQDSDGDSGDTNIVVDQDGDFFSLREIEDSPDRSIQTASTEGTPVASSSTGQPEPPAIVRGHEAGPGAGRQTRSGNSRSFKRGAKAQRSADAEAPDMTAQQRRLCQWDDLSAKDRKYGYWFVHHILAYPTTISGPEYRIKWLGFNESFITWEPYEHLDGCISLLREFHEAHPQYPFPEGLRERVGASSNPDAWITVDRVLHLIKMDLSKIFRTRPPIPVERFRDGLANEDALYIANVGHHAFVILHFAKLRFCIIGDGENDFLDNERIAALIVQKINDTPSRGLLYVNSFYEDECGGCAALIGREFLRMYNSSKEHPSKWPEEIHVSCNQRDKLLSREYAGEDLKPLPNATLNIHHRPHYKCPHCDWSTNSTSKVRLINYMRLKHSK